MHFNLQYFQNMLRFTVFLMMTIEMFEGEYRNRCFYLLKQKQYSLFKLEFSRIEFVILLVTSIVAWRVHIKTQKMHV